MQLQAPEEPEQKEDPKASKAKDAKGKKRWADGNEWAMGMQLSAMNAQDVVFMWLVFLQTFVDVWGGEHHHFSIGASLGWWSPIDFHIFAALGWVETYARPPNSGALIKPRFGFGKLSTSSWQARLKVKWEVKLEKRETPKMAGAEVSNNWDICMDYIEERGAISTHRYDPNHGEKNLRYMGVCVSMCVKPVIRHFGWDNDVTPMGVWGTYFSMPKPRNMAAMLCQSLRSFSFSTVSALLMSTWHHEPCWSWWTNKAAAAAMRTELWWHHQHVMIVSQRIFIGIMQW